MEASAGYKQNWPIEIQGTFHVTQTQQMFLFELKRSYSHQKTSQMHFKYDISATVKKGCTLEFREGFHWYVYGDFQNVSHCLAATAWVKLIFTVV